YMTGGKVLVLGPTGKNFAAGMSGGIAYVLDEHHDFYLNLNKSMVSMETVSEKHDIEEITAMLKEHLAATGSALAERILADLPAYLPLFKKIVPEDYRKMLNAIGHFEKKGLTREQAELEAFYKVTKK
ncbi:MAG: hypothetical protein ACI4LN_05560, partial [Anaerovoracaceae bacterium]